MKRCAHGICAVAALLALLALAPPARANELAGWTWKVRSLGGERVARGFGDSIRFLENRAVARVHCNRVKAVYIHVDGLTMLEFARLSSTRRACGRRKEPALGLTEAMRRTQVYDVSRNGKRLTLFAANGSGDGLTRLAKLRRVGPFRPDDL